MSHPPAHDYDEAVFIQELRKRARFNRVTRLQVAEAFWAAAWDLREAFLQQKPDRLAAAEAEVIENVVPRLALVIAEQTNIRVDL